MPTVSSSAVSARENVPFAYQLSILFLEPLFALGGVYIMIFDRSNYLSTMTGLPTSAYDPRTGFLYTGYVGAWLMFSFIEAVVFRMYDDLELWRTLCTAMLFSDLGYFWSTAEALGGWGELIKVNEWRKEDWTVFLSTFFPMLAKILLVLGVGVTRNRSTAKGKKQK